MTTTAALLLLCVARMTPEQEVEAWDPFEATSAQQQQQQPEKNLDGRATTSLLVPIVAVGGGMISGAAVALGMSGPLRDVSVPFGIVVPTFLHLTGAVSDRHDILTALRPAQIELIHRIDILRCFSVELRRQLSEKFLYPGSAHGRRTKEVRGGAAYPLLRPCVS